MVVAVPDAVAFDQVVLNGVAFLASGINALSRIGPIGICQRVGIAQARIVDPTVPDGVSTGVEFDTVQIGLGNFQSVHNDIAGPRHDSDAMFGG